MYSSCWEHYIPSAMRDQVFINQQSPFLHLVIPRNQTSLVSIILLQKHSQYATEEERLLVQMCRDMKGKLSAQA